jgi:membrane fusion protein, macrolide-specific efflux system
MKLRMPVWMWGLAAALLVAASVVWARMGGSDASATFNTATVVRADIEDAVTALGSMQPQEFVDVGTQVSGQLKRVFVNIGDNVKQGSVVAEIDTALLTAKVEAAQATLQSLAAQIEEKQVQLVLAQRQHKRNASMFAQDAISRDALETSQTATQVMAAQVAALKAQRHQTDATLKIDQTNLGNARIHAPMAGTVVALNARQGQTLNASQQAPVLMRLAKLDTMTVVTQVSEADVVRLAPGTPAYFSTMGRPDRRWRGSVRQVLPTPDTVNNVVLYNVLFDVDNSDTQLLPQMSAQVFFVLAKAKNALVIPAAALGDKQAGSSEAGAADKTYRVRVLNQGRAEERSVVVGVMNRLSAQALSGLAEGDQVLLNAGAPAKREAKSNGKADGKSDNKSDNNAEAKSKSKAKS